MRSIGPRADRWIGRATVLAAMAALSFSVAWQSPAPARPIRALRAPVVGGNPPMPPQIIRDQVPEARVEVVARNLEIPWAIAFSPDGRMFFTERIGRVRVMRDGAPPKPYLDLRATIAVGEGGLMGLALHPKFPQVPYLYVVYSTRKRGLFFNRVSRFRDVGGLPQQEKVLVDNIPAAQYHDGGVIAFGPDGMLYVGTGDATNPPNGQDLTSLAGKILRFTEEGEVPADNPFPGSLVYAYGFRNVSGLAWQPGTGALWATMHGPTGEFPNLEAHDSVYVVKKGGNHGWPLVVGTTNLPDVESPILHYPDPSVPPGGAMFYTGTLFPQWRNNFFFTSLRAEHLQRVTVEGERDITAIERWWPGKYGRLRAVTQGPDGAIYFSTSNRDGRASRNFPGADFIYRLVPAR